MSSSDNGTSARTRSSLIRHMPPRAPGRWTRYIKHCILPGDLCREIHRSTLYVLHAFEKRTQRTRQGDIGLPGRGSRSSTGRASGSKELAVESAIGPSCGDVLRTSVPQAGAVSLELRSFLAFRLEESSKTNELTPTPGGGLLRVSQPRISDLVRARIELLVSIRWWYHVHPARVKVPTSCSGRARAGKDTSRCVGPAGVTSSFPDRILDDNASDPGRLCLRRLRAEAPGLHALVR